MSEKQYRVEPAKGHEGCATCQHGAYYTVVYKDEDGEDVEIGTSWMDLDFTEEVCDLMNDAYEAGKESK